MSICQLYAAFDMITMRELDVLAQLRSRHRRVRLLLLDDELITSVYGRPPIMPLAERMLLAQHLRGLDEVVVYDPGQPPGSQAGYVIAGDPVPMSWACQAIVPAAGMAVA
ncbi:hypothetical protein [Microlunatus sp. Y2014]|uniref:hypothetical protein n=1 Tax=Microlunatus sp. Y2014 TaxID=3418488 RepID=UPI003DA6F4D7